MPTFSRTHETNVIRTNAATNAGTNVISPGLSAFQFFPDCQADKLKHPEQMKQLTNRM